MPAASLLSAAHGVEAVEELEPPESSLLSAPGTEPVLHQAGEQKEQRAGRLCCPYILFMSSNLCCLSTTHLQWSIRPFAACVMQTFKAGCHIQAHNHPSIHFLTHFCTQWCLLEPDPQHTKGKKAGNLWLWMMVTEGAAGGSVIIHG